MFSVNFFFTRIILIFCLITLSCKKNHNNENKKIEDLIPKVKKNQEFVNQISIKNDSQEFVIKVINPTFLGNNQRNFYGKGIPKKWNLQWKTWLGSGKTIVKKGQEQLWSGAGWTGQPLFYLENEHPYLLQGAYDYHLKKIDALNGKIVWEYPFEDVIKGTGTIWLNSQTEIPELKAVVIQGSRQSKNYHQKNAPALKAISLINGKCVWELNVEKTKSYSRDVDASALIVNDTAYIGLENGYFLSFLPDARQAKHKNELLQPKILKKVKLYKNEDAVLHAGNLVIEASPAYFDRKVFISAGSGHVVTYDLDQKKIVWDYFIGSDLDGSPVVTPDSCILVSIEKQYIKGNGGVLKLNPKNKNVEWFFPTQNKNFADWKGGLIGSPSISDSLCAFIAIDGNTYVVHLNKVQSKTVKLFDSKTEVFCPMLIFKYPTGPSISTPLWVDNHLICAGYHGIHIFYRENQNFKLIKKIPGRFEATPFVYNKRLYIASRDGYLYCYGE